MICMLDMIASTAHKYYIVIFIIKMNVIHRIKKWASKDHKWKAFGIIIGLSSSFWWLLELLWLFVSILSSFLSLTIFDKVKYDFYLSQPKVQGWVLWDFYLYIHRCAMPYLRCIASSKLFPMYTIPILGTSCLAPSEPHLAFYVPSVSCL